MYGWTDRWLRGSRRLLINVSERSWLEFYWSLTLQRLSNGVESERKESGTNRRRNRNVDGISFGHSGAMKRIFESEVIYRLITDQLFQAGRDGRSRLCTRVSRSIYFEYISRGSQRSDPISVPKIELPWKAAINAIHSRTTSTIHNSDGRALRAVSPRSERVAPSTTS